MGYKGNDYNKMDDEFVKSENKRKIDFFKNIDNPPKKRYTPLSDYINSRKEIESNFNLPRFKKINTINCKRNIRYFVRTKITGAKSYPGRMTGKTKSKNGQEESKLKGQEKTVRALLENQLLILKDAFGEEKEVCYQLENMDSNIILRIERRTLPHLFGPSFEKGYLGDKFPQGGGFIAWLDKYLHAGKDENNENVREFNKLIKMNSGRLMEKCKNMYLFDLFNPYEEIVRAKKMTQEDVKNIYGDVYSKPKKPGEYIVLERTVKYRKKKRYVSMLFRKDEKDDRGIYYYPISIVETDNQKLKDNKETRITKAKMPDIHQDYKELSDGITSEDVNEASDSIWQSINEEGRGENGNGENVQGGKEK